MGSGQTLKVQPIMTSTYMAEINSNTKSNTNLISNQ